MRLFGRGEQHILRQPLFNASSICKTTPGFRTERITNCETFKKNDYSRDSYAQVHTFYSILRPKNTRTRVFFLSPKRSSVKIDRHHLKRQV